MAAPLELTRTHRILIGLVVTGAAVIAGIGFSGSYAAVRELAEEKGFGRFSLFFPIGIDAGICVLLALDLLLTWIRIPFPLLRQTAWLLTVATIAFNGAAAWPDPLGVGMHAVIPVLFVVSVEAARHAVGRIADITADKHMEGVRLTRWLLSPLPTFLLWRRMKLWELRSYEQTIRLEQERLVYQARLRSRFGRAWRRRAPVESLMPLRLARYGIPLAETAPAGLAAAGIEPTLLPAAPERVTHELASAEPRTDGARATDGRSGGRAGAGFAHDGEFPGHAEFSGHGEYMGADGFPDPDQYQRSGRYQGQGQYQDPGQYEDPGQDPEQWEQQNPWFATPQQEAAAYDGAYDPSYTPQEQYEEWYEQQQQQEGQGQEQGQQAVGEELPQEGAFRVPSGPNRTRPLGGADQGQPQTQGQTQGQGTNGHDRPIPGPRAEQLPMDPEVLDAMQQAQPGTHADADAVTVKDVGQASGLPDDMSLTDAYFQAFHRYVKEHLDFPNARQFGLYLQDLYGVAGQSGGPLTEGTLRPYLRDFRERYQQDMDAEHIA